MLEIFFEALLDTVKLVPFLLIIYIGIELVEYKWGSRIREQVQKAGKAGPAIGAVVGSLPQCGFSVVATALYVERLATIGTLLAVYLATSDEAIPIILAQPDKAGLIIPIIFTKIIVALVAGFSVDFLYRRANKKTLSHIEAYSKGQDDAGHRHAEILEREESCCGHNSCPLPNKFNYKEIFLHPIIHTAKIFLFIFFVSLAINFLIFWVGEQVFADFLSGYVWAQPLLAALVGLIPNCAASVAITELYLSGAITFGAVIAGLCASGGLGLLVLLREESDRKRVYSVIGLLFGISIVAGMLVQYIF